MANYTAADIKALREQTGAGMMDAKLMPFDAKRMIYGGFECVVSG